LLYEPNTWTKVQNLHKNVVGFFSPFVRLLFKRQCFFVLVVNYTNLPLLYFWFLMVFQTSSIIFLDGPVGAGFSYANTTEAWNTTDTLWAAQSYEFIRNVSVFDDKKK
jgi:hypothetical protein